MVTLSKAQAEFPSLGVSDILPRGFAIFTFFLARNKTCFIIGFGFLQKRSCFLSLELQRNVEAAFSVYLANMRYNLHKTIAFAD